MSAPGSGRDGRGRFTHEPGGGDPRWRAPAPDVFEMGGYTKVPRKLRDLRDAAAIGIYYGRASGSPGRRSAGTPACTKRWAGRRDQ